MCLERILDFVGADFMTLSPGGWRALLRFFIGTALPLLLLTLPVFSQDAPMPDVPPSASPTPSGPNATTPAGQLQTPADLEALFRGKESSREELKKIAEQLSATWKDATPPEYIRMLQAIAQGSQMGGESGWFGKGQSRYSWDWLARRHDLGTDDKAAITEAEFRGPKELFRGLDRNGNGRITKDDFDWSDDNSYVEAASLAHRFFRRMDLEGDGRITRDEMLAFFDKAAGGKDYLLSGDLRRAILAGWGSYLPGDAPTPESLITGLFRSELGSLHEGPALEAPAPDFRLKTQDGRREVHLQEEIGKRPIVLMFGNFTCAPFRSYLPVVEELHERYGKQATFLGVYVREAHPTDGWYMESNTKAGVKLPQPRTYAERAGVASQCHAKLRYSMPLLVDEIDDPVGNAYSGMPARLYIIDSQGKVAYKAGRGPFGLKPGEMEQSLVMLLLDEAKPEAK